MANNPGRRFRATLSTLAAILLLPIVAPFLLVWAISSLVRRITLVWQFRHTFGRQGKVGVLVYSDSPHWKERVETLILPRVGARLVTLNWSRRAEWAARKPLEAQIFEHWAGSRAYNPLAIIIHGYGRVQTIRFFEAFKANKHGRPDELRLAEEELFAVIEAA